MMSVDIFITASTCPCASKIGVVWTITVSARPLLLCSSSSLEWLSPSRKVRSTGQFSQASERCL